MRSLPARRGETARAVVEGRARSARIARQARRACAASWAERRSEMSSTVYLALFGLKEAPFSKEIPDAELWLPGSKLAVVDTLLEALDERASVMLVGEPGVGETCVLRALRH